jgi:uncharacterized protein (TIGR02118 family)
MSMPATLLVMYGTPTDPAAFSKDYAVHIPMAQKIPGLRTFEVSRGPINPPGGTAPYETIALLTFDSMAELQAGLGSPEGQAAVAHAQEIATGGLSVFIYERQAV